MTALDRDQSLARVRHRATPWDLIVIGGGATGTGVALDAASRGLDVLLLEQSDFGKGTSSRSTKLVHGGVRYLRQGNLALVRDALRERGLLRENAPHLVHDLPFLIPCRSRWQRFFYGVGLKLYDAMARRDSFGRSHGVSAQQAARLVPAICRSGLRGGVVYHDGQFDDARLLINMIRTASDHGGCVLNYAAATRLIKDGEGMITGVGLTDSESNTEFMQSARCVINAAGPFCDDVRRFDEPSCEPMISPSQGVHLVLPRECYPGDVALIVPKTSDGRVIFVIPWNEVVIVGTTDTPISEVILEPAAQRSEIKFLLDTASEYLEQDVQPENVLSVFAGIRPLVSSGVSAQTASLSRDHVIRVSDSGLITITGGKWTTVRKMSEDCVDQAVERAKLSAGPCLTKSLKLHGFVASTPHSARENHQDRRAHYGTDLQSIAQIESESSELAKPLHPALAVRGSDVVWSVRCEMARTVDDVLSRRSRSLILNAAAAVEIAPEVARLMAGQLDRDRQWCDQQVDAFGKIAQRYLLPTG
jgi:glycerol-3-phosphate dehydrogenase